MLAHSTLISFYLCMLCLDSVFVGGGGVDWFSSYEEM